MVAVGVADVRPIVDRVCARPDVLEACRKRDLGYVIKALYEDGLTQGKMGTLTGKPQGRISEWVRGIRAPQYAHVIDEIATGLGFPSAARRALGLTADPPAAAAVAPLAGSPLDAGLTFPETPAEAADAVSRLWRADLEDPTEPQQRTVDPRAWGDASLKWLVGPPRSRGAETFGRVQVGTPDVERFRATVAMFGQLDDRFGGGNARQALIQYLTTDAERLLRGRFTDAIGCELYSAAAEATLLAAWMTYDSTPSSGLAQRYFVQALALAKAAGDRLLGATILDAMSHQATYMGRYSDAANLARAARTGTGSLATPTQAAHFHTMEARALARLGDAKGCDRALAEAVREFERRNPGDDPDWISYFNDVELNAEFAHCYRDLGRAGIAMQYAAQGFLSPDDTSFIRSDFFVAVVLADCHLAAGDIEQACATARKALDAGEQLRSARCVGYLREFSRHLARIGDTTSVVDFGSAASQSRLWRIALRDVTAGQ
ncbi:MAG TPA: helix-turn-helix transcriptional regulator [Streptosporangiaceae bacterium]|nr:helix-turn-helix transcriptional regulator [Streptosporangiaceae bacterium]